MSILTFPGVIVHEIAHLLMCRMFGVPVRKVCYFRFGNPAGYVLHDVPRSPYQNLVIGIGPFLVNSIVGALVGLPAAIGGVAGLAGSPSHLVLLWLGVSVAMHAFPSTGDAKSIWQCATAPGTSCLARIVVLPFVALIYLGALGSVVWLDLLYGVAVVAAIPWLLAR